MNHAHISNLFQRFAAECTGSSDLYTSLSPLIASDSDLLEIAANASAGQPIPNLFFGAVHYLLSQQSEHPLAQYYPSLAHHPKRSDHHVFGIFKAFCIANKASILHLLQTKLVQTNEVGRCAYLYPCFCLIHRIAKKPLALIEIGTSAGLQLMWDKYSYTYSHALDTIYGDPHSSMLIPSELRGSSSPDLQLESPPVAARIGIDLHVNDLSDKEDYHWLKALIWPEHNDRRKQFEQAAAYVKEANLQLIKGDALFTLPSIVKQMPEDAALCIFHTHVANQLSPEAKQQLLDFVSEIGAYREVFHLYNNICDKQLHLDYYFLNHHRHFTLANTEGHGRWFEWLLHEQKQ